MYFLVVISNIICAAGLQNPQNPNFETQGRDHLAASGQECLSTVDSKLQEQVRDKRQTTSSVCWALIFLIAALTLIFQRKPQSFSYDVPAEYCRVLEVPAGIYPLVIPISILYRYQNANQRVNIGLARMRTNKGQRLRQFTATPLYQYNSIFMSILYGRTHTAV